MESAAFRDASHHGEGPLNINGPNATQHNFNQGGSRNQQVNVDRSESAAQSSTYSNHAAHDNATVISGVVHGGVTINSKVADKFSGNYSSGSIRPVAKYVPRQELHQQMQERIHDVIEARDESAKILIVCGLGGAGKSQLALNYVKTYRKDYSATFWLDASTRASLESDYAQIHKLLFPGVAGVGISKVDTDQCINAVRHWFQGQSGRWLWVLDSADSIDAPEHADFIDLGSYLPDAPSIDIIITTRSQTAKDMTNIEAVQVAELSRAEARDLFLRRSNLERKLNNDPEAIAKVDDITQELGHFALAVNLAGAYVGATPRMQKDLGQYLVDYRKRRKDLLSRQPKRHVDQYGESVLTTWETSYAALVTHCPTAARLLHLLAFLSHEDLFDELFTLSGNDTPGTHETNEATPTWRSFISPDGPIEDLQDDSFAQLVNYSLIQRKDQQGGYAMHNLVHAWSYERLPVNEQAGYCLAAWDLLQSFTLGHIVDPKMKLRFGPHVMLCFARMRERFKPGDAKVKDALDRLDRVADNLRESGQWEAEYALRVYVHESLKSEGGGNDLRVSESQSEFAQVLWRKGMFTEAEKLQRQVLEGREKVLGETHLYTLISVNNLALVLSNQGKYEAAEELHRRALEGSEKILGETHPDTLKHVSNLALVLTSQGKYEAAEELHRRALEGSQKILGETHPDTLKNVSNLALVLYDREKYKAAEELYYRALEGNEKLLGETHPDTLTSVDNLALVFTNQGKYKTAEELHRRALEGREKVLGETHPDTLSSVSNLAAVLSSQKQYRTAEELHRRALDGREKVLGETHLETLQSVWQLAWIFHETKRPDESLKSYGRAVAGFRQSLGDGHPRTIGCSQQMTERFGSVGESGGQSIDGDI